MEYVIGVDIGTTNTKAIATDLDGMLLYRFEMANTTISPSPGHYEQDPQELFDTTKICIAKVVQYLKGTHSEMKVSGVCFSSAMHGVIALDEFYRPLTNCILWSDNRSADTASALKGSALGDQIYSRTGTPIHAMSPLSKIAWMKTNTPDIHSCTQKFISIKEYIFFKLFDEFLVDFSIASATGLFDVHRQQWYTASLDYAGIKEDQLSRPVPITHRSEGLLTADAEEMGLAADTPFILGGSDGCLANLGVGATGPGVAAVTIGTSGAIRVSAKAPGMDTAGRIFSYVLTPELHIIGGPVNNGGNVLQWFLNNLYTDVQSETGIASVESLVETAASVAPGADGLVFLPYLLGERAPLWDASAKGAYFGVRMHHKNAHFARAAIEGVVFGLFHVAKVLMEQTGRVDAIHATGGFFESSFCVQLLADVFNTPVHVKEEVDGSALGAVIVALYALGHLPSLHDVQEQTDVTLVYPDKNRNKQYVQAFERYTSLVELLINKF